MKLSKTDLELLKNVSQSVDTVKFIKGKKQNFTNKFHSIVIQTELQESFPVLFGIYQKFSSFLSTIELLENPELDFGVDENDNEITFVTIKNSNDKNKIRYYGSILDFIEDVPELNFPDLEKVKEIQLSKQNLDNILHVSKVMMCKNVVLINTNNKLILKTCTSEDEDYKHFYETEIGDCELPDFKITLERELMKFIPSSYIIKTDLESPFVIFESSDYNIKYAIAYDLKYSHFQG